MKDKYIIFIVSVICLLMTYSFFMTNRSDFHKAVMSSDVPLVIYTDSSKYERYRRPSKQIQLDLNYESPSCTSFERWYEDDLNIPYTPKGFPDRYNSSEDVIHAYYAIIKNAEVLSGLNHGGCGTIGCNGRPYPYAYDLLDKETKSGIIFNDYMKSFAGTGHTTLLKLYPAYNPNKNKENIDYYMFEHEIITGPPITEDNEDNLMPSFFAYYYGIITTTYDEKEGWKIRSIDYIPQNFLCAPFHSSWKFEGSSLVEVIYKNWYNLIDSIDRIDQKDSLISIYGSGKENEYRFDFVRLTNGIDILLHEYIRVDNKWEEVNILKPEHQEFKLSILNFQ